MKPILSKADLAQPKRRVIKLSDAKLAEQTRRKVREKLALSAGVGWRVPVHIERSELHWTETVKDDPAIVPESEMPTVPSKLREWIRKYAVGDDHEVTEAELRARIMFLELTEYLPRVGATVGEIATAFTRDLTAVIGKLEREAGMRRRGRPREYRLEPADAAALVAYTTLVALLDWTRADKPELAELAVYIEDGDLAGTWQSEAAYATGNADRQASPLLRAILAAAPHLDRPAQLAAVKLHLADYVRIIRLCDDPGLLACANCIVDIRDPERITTLPFSPDLVFTRKPAGAYDPEAPSPVRTLRDGSEWTLDNWFKELAEVPGDEEETAARLPLYRQILAKAIDPNLPAHVMLCAYDGGVGSTGKGTLVALIRAIVGGGNVFDTTLPDLCGQFGLEGLGTKPIVFFEEIPTNIFECAPEKLKQLIDGTTLDVDRKRKTHVAQKFRGLTLACFNELPRVADKSESFTRRLVFRRFIKTYNHDRGDMEDTRVREGYMDSPEVVAYATRMGVEAAHEWLHSADPDHFSTTPGDAATKAEFRAINDPIYDFVQTELCECNAAVTGMSYNVLYQLYTEWYKRNISHNGNGVPLKKRFETRVLPLLDQAGWASGQRWRARYSDAVDIEWDFFDQYAKRKAPFFVFERGKLIRGIKRVAPEFDADKYDREGFSYYRNRELVEFYD